MIPCKINFVGGILPFFGKERLLLATKNDLAQKRAATKLATNDRAAERSCFEQRHARIGRKGLFFDERPYKTAKHATAIKGCHSGNNDAPNKRGDDHIDNIGGLLGNRKIVVRTKANGKIGFAKVGYQLTKR